MFAAGWRETFQKFDAIPNRKTDTNNHGPFSSDNIGMNYDYPEESSRGGGDSAGAQRPKGAISSRTIRESREVAMRRKWDSRRTSSPTTRLAASDTCARRGGAGAFVMTEHSC